MSEYTRLYQASVRVKGYSLPRAQMSTDQLSRMLHASLDELQRALYPWTSNGVLPDNVAIDGGLIWAYHPNSGTRMAILVDCDRVEVMVDSEPYGWRTLGEEEQRQYQFRKRRAPKLHQPGRPHAVPYR